jgi:DNA modification methylase
MTPYYEQDNWTIYHGDCREILPSLSGASSIVTDPPYELGFMGKSWDSQGVSFQKETWEIIRKSCLSGSPLLSFGGSRTQHRIACAIEDAGWEIRDTLMWVYGSGFPKSLNISKAIQKEREKIGEGKEFAGLLEDEAKFCQWIRNESGLTQDDLKAIVGHDRFYTGKVEIVNTHTTEDPIYGRRSCVPTYSAWQNIKQSITRAIPQEIEELVKAQPEGIMRGPGQLDTWQSGKGEGTKSYNEWGGYGTALKPAYEPIILAMNPLDGTFANNALKHKVVGLNIDGCRIGTEVIPPQRQGKDIRNNSWSGNGGKSEYVSKGATGRFPANFLHDGSQMVMELFPKTAPTSYATDRTHNSGIFHVGHGTTKINDNTHSAARFFYCAKASKAERDRGCEDLPEEPMNLTNTMGRTWNDRCKNCGKKFIGPPEKICHCENPQTDKSVYKLKNNHPTVKPLALMEYLCKLVKMPEYNLIIDPFMGSGTTLLACINLGIPCIGIDNDEKSCEIAVKRGAICQH